MAKIKGEGVSESGQTEEAGKGKAKITGVTLGWLTEEGLVRKSQSLAHRMVVEQGVAYGTAIIKAQHQVLTEAQAQDPAYQERQKAKSEAEKGKTS